MKKAYKEMFGYDIIDTVYAVIDGVHMYLTETEVTYLQVKCANTDNFDEFAKRFVIHAGHSKDSEIMEWTPSGRFNNEFESGFYDKITNLVYKLY